MYKKLNLKYFKNEFLAVGVKFIDIRRDSIQKQYTLANGGTVGRLVLQAER